MLDESKRLSQSGATFTWCSDDFLVQHDVKRQTELPLWAPRRPGEDGHYGISNDKARAAGLTFRSAAETIRDTLAWAVDRPAHSNGMGGPVGLSPERERSCSVCGTRMSTQVLDVRGPRLVTLAVPTKEPPTMSDVMTIGTPEWTAARLEIAELASRYAVAVDSRDLDTIASLFVPDVDAGRRGTGRDAIRAYYDDVLRNFRSSMHFVGTQAVQFDDSGTSALGHTYCIAEHEGADHWFRVGIDYEDTYRVVDGRWLFERRVFEAGSWTAWINLAPPRPVRPRPTSGDPSSAPQPGTSSGDAAGAEPPGRRSEQIPTNVRDRNI